MSAPSKGALDGEGSPDRLDAVPQTEQAGATLGVNSSDTVIVDRQPRATFRGLKTASIERTTASRAPFRMDRPYRARGHLISS